MASLKRKRLSISQNHKAITEAESGTKPLNVAPKNLVLPEIQYQHDCYLEKKKIFKSLLNLVRLGQKGKTRGLDRMRTGRKRYLTGLIL